MAGEDGDWAAQIHGGEVTRIDVSSVTMDLVQQLYSTAAARLTLATKGLSVGEVIELHDETTKRSRVATVTELTGDYWVWVVVE